MTDGVIFITPSPIPTITPHPTPLISAVSDVIVNWVLPIALVCIVIAVVAVVLHKVVKLRFKKKNNELLFKDFNVGEYKIVMMRKIAGKYTEIERIKIKVSDEKWRYNNKDFSAFNKDMIAFCDKRNNYYAFDYDNGTQLSFREVGLPQKITIDVIDMYVNRHLIADLVQGLETPKGKGQWTMLIIGIIIGCAIGFIIGQQVTNYQNTPKLILTAIR